MTYQFLVVEDGEVGVITLNRPKVLNALSFALRDELRRAVTAMEERPDIRSLVITGAGDRAFSAGDDIHEMASLAPERLSLFQAGMMDFNWRLANLKVPTIGAINGLAYGGGALLASSFDIRIGCERTKFRFLAAQYGRLNSTWSLPLIVGWAKAKELIYTGRVVDAEEALQIGLLNKLVPSDQILQSAREMAEQIARNSPLIVQGAKRLLNQNPGRSWQEMYDSEIDAVTSHLKPVDSIAESFGKFLAAKGRNNEEGRDE